MFAGRVDRKPVHHTQDGSRRMSGGKEGQRGILHVGSGYQSDPSPSPSGPATCKTQPPNTNLNIPPKNIIRMPPDRLGLSPSPSPSPSPNPNLFGRKNGSPPIPVGSASPIPRSDTSTTPIQHSEQSSVTKTESVTAKSTSSSHVPSLPSGSQVPGVTSASQHPTSAHTYTSCGHPNHSHMTSYPYHHPVTSHLLSNPVFDVPNMALTPTSNGTRPTPHLYSGFAYHIPNLPLSPDLFLNQNQNVQPSGAMPSLYPHNVVTPAVGGHSVLQRSNNFHDRCGSCYNCGSAEHDGPECTEDSIETICGEFILIEFSRPSLNNVIIFSFFSKNVKWKYKTHSKQLSFAAGGL